MMEKPDVDHIEGLSPAISIEQKAASHNPRIHRRDGDRDSRLPAPECTPGWVHPAVPRMMKFSMPQTVSQMVDTVLAMPKAAN